MFRTLSLGAQHLSSSEKTAPRRQGKSGYLPLQQREQAVWISKIRCQVTEFSILCVGRCEPLGSLIAFLSYAPQLSGTHLVSSLTLHLASPQLLSNDPGDGGRHWITILGALIHTGGQKSLMAVTFLIYWYGRRCFHFTQLINKKSDLKEAISTDLSKNIWSLD